MTLLSKLWFQITLAVLIAFAAFLFGTLADKSQNNFLSSIANLPQAPGYVIAFFVAMLTSRNIHTMSLAPVVPGNLLFYFYMLNLSARFAAYSNAKKLRGRLPSNPS